MLFNHILLSTLLVVQAFACYESECGFPVHHNTFSPRRFPVWQPRNEWEPYAAEGYNYGANGEFSAPMHRFMSFPIDPRINSAAEQQQLVDPEMESRMIDKFNPPFLKGYGTPIRAGIRPFAPEIDSSTESRWGFILKALSDLRGYNRQNENYRSFLSKFSPLDLERALHSMTKQDRRYQLDSPENDKHSTADAQSQSSKDLFPNVQPAPSTSRDVEEISRLNNSPFNFPSSEVSGDIPSADRDPLLEPSNRRYTEEMGPDSSEGKNKPINPFFANSVLLPYSSRMPPLYSGAVSSLLSGHYKSEQC